MKCFQHAEQEAVGVCRHCGKGLCRECLVETEHGLTCRGRCERDAGMMRELLHRSDRDAQGYRGVGIVLVITAIFLAIFMMGLPSMAEQWFGQRLSMGWLLTAGYGLTAIIFASGIICYRQGGPA